MEKFFYEVEKNYLKVIEEKKELNFNWNESYFNF